MIKKIGILTFWPFPEGMAPTTRILAYSKGLVENNVKVEIYTFNRIFKNEIKSKKKSGIVNGVDYLYLHFFHMLGKRFKIFRFIDEIILRVKLVWLVWKSHKKLSFDCFFISFDDNHSFGAYLKLIKIFNIPLVFVADEYPIPIRDFMKDKVPEDMMSIYRNYHRSFSARILMSNSLKDFYDKEIFPLPTFILNTIVDLDRFKGVEKLESSNQPYLCYMGNLDLRKDNVQNIIEAFSILSERYNKIQLHLYGSPSKEQLIILEEKINFFNLTDRILLKGIVPASVVPGILINALILVNSQPITKRAEGGFPTKLGEYLLSSRPSVFTDSGDISAFIKDGVHAFIVEPENPIAYSNKLNYILENYDLACSVAKAGERYVKENFDSKKQISKLLNFLNENNGK